MNFSSRVLISSIQSHSSSNRVNSCWVMTDLSLSSSQAISVRYHPFTQLFSDSWSSIILPSSIIFLGNCGLCSCVIEISSLWRMIVGPISSHPSAPLGPQETINLSGLYYSLLSSRPFGHLENVRSSTGRPMAPTYIALTRSHLIWWIMAKCNMDVPSIF